MYVQCLIITMSWYNPSPQEAVDAYVYYRNKYYNAANQRNASMRQEEIYLSQKRTANTKINTLSAQKLNFEKRLNGVIKIIKMLDGTGSGFLPNVPSSISKAMSTLKKADTSYKRSIKMTGGVSAASLETAFSVKSVQGDHRSADALRAYKAEKVRLEQKIANLKKQINSLTSQITTLNKNIDACNIAQASYTHTMNSSAYEMNHYRKYMY